MIVYGHGPHGMGLLTPSQVEKYPETAKWPQEMMKFLREQGIAILFSTHITTDLEKCADDITYIAKGSMIASEPLGGFLERCRELGKGEDLETIMVNTEKESLYEKLAH